jgi:uncharacterized caspase-like protein
MMLDGARFLTRSTAVAAVWTGLIFAVAALLLAVAPATAADRVALVIGNGAYQKVPALPNPPRDAADIARAFERLDFKVTRLTNANAAEMRKALVEFGHASEGSLISVIYYAGHGMEAGGENWLIPVDAELRSDTDVESEAISLRSLNLQVGKARKLGLIILDACRNNPFAATMKRSLTTRAVERGLAPTEPTDNVLIAYAARDGTTASDGDGHNSPFTTALLRNIETPGLEIAFLFRRVRDDVMTATNRQQQPFVYGSLSKEEIYLKPTLTAAPAPAPISPATPASTAEDEQFWRAIETSTETGLYEEFLSRYPRSAHAAEARQRLHDLKARQVAAATPTTDGSSSQNSTKPADRRTFTAEDAARVAARGTEQKLKMPLYSFMAMPSNPLGPNSRFVGVWSNKRGWGNGQGRYGMLIVTDVSADGAVRGYYLWGASQKASWSRSPAGNIQFSGQIVDNAFSFQTGDVVKVKLGKDNSLTLTSFREGKPSDTASIELYPMWQLDPPAREDTVRSVTRHASRKK